MKKIYLLSAFLLLLFISKNGQAQISGSTNACIGFPEAYSCTSASGYSWYATPAGYGTFSDTAAQNITFTPVTATTQYTLTCVTSAPTNTFTIVLYNYSVDTPIVSNQTICSGAQASIPATGSVGTYYWFTVPSGGTPVDSNATYLTPPLTSTTQYYVEASNGACTSARNSVTVNINALPTVIGSSNSPLCDGAALNFVSSGATTYSWSGPMGFTSSMPNPIINPVSISNSGTYTVTGVGANGCSNSSTVNVVVNSNPVVMVTGGNSVCLGDAISLFASGATVYSWSPSTGLSSSNVSSPVASPTTTTTYTITGTSANGCTGSTTHNIMVTPLTHINGIVNSSAGNLTAEAYLLKFNPLHPNLDTFDIVSLSSNQYTFFSIPTGNYLVKVVPDTGLHPNIVPTYYGDSFQWDSVAHIAHGCLTDDIADINMIELLGGSGTGNISGTLTEGIGFGQKLIGGPNHVFVPGGPLKGIDIKLGKNPGSGIQARTTSDSTGRYAFNNLPDGNYTIYVDIPGLPMDSSYTVTIDPANQDYSFLNYYVDSNSVYPVDVVGINSVVSKSKDLIIYPNPANRDLSIVFTSDEPAAIISISDIQGRELFSMNSNLPSKGVQNVKINLSNLNLLKGMYFVTLKTDSGNQTLRFIKD